MARSFSAAISGTAMVRISKFRVERGADVGPFWFVDDRLAIADLDLDLTVWQQRSGDADVVEVETASAVGCRRFLGMEPDGVADAGLPDCLGYVEGVELALCRIVTGGIDVLAETENAVDVTQDEPTLEDELPRKSKGEMRSEREEGEVPRCELRAAGALVEQVGQLVRATPESPRCCRLAHASRPSGSVLAFTMTRHVGSTCPLVTPPRRRSTGVLLFPISSRNGAAESASEEPID